MLSLKWRRQNLAIFEHGSVVGHSGQMYRTSSCFSKSKVEIAQNEGRYFPNGQFWISPRLFATLTSYAVRNRLASVSSFKDVFLFNESWKHCIDFFSHELKA